MAGNLRTAKNQKRLDSGETSSARLFSSRPVVLKCWGKVFSLLLFVLLLLTCFAQETKADSGLFQYAVWRPDDRIVTAPFVDGVVAYVHWNVLEREPGAIDVTPIVQIRSRVMKQGKRFILRIVTAEHSPAWLYRMGVPRVYEKIDGQLRAVPVYWSPIYLQRLNILVEKIARDLDGDNSLAAVQIGIATYGEMLLGGREWSSNGFSPLLWTNTCQKIIDVYRDHFKKTPLVVMIMSQEFPHGRQTDSLLPVAQYAADNGIGLQFNGLSADNSYLWGLLDLPDETSAIAIMRRFRQSVPVYLEMTDGKVDVTLSCLNAISEQASYLFVYTAMLDDPSLAPIFEFTRRFLGKTPANADAVWTLLRQTFPKDNIRTGKKNYEYGLLQRELHDLIVYRSDGGSLNIRAKTSAVDRFSGLPSRRTREADNFQHMAFKISDEFDPGPTPVLSVIYADKGEDLWFPMYTARGKLHACAPIRKNNSGKWLRADFRLDGFSKGSPIDLVIDSNNDGDEFIHFVQLTRSGSDVILPFSIPNVNY